MKIQKGFLTFTFILAMASCSILFLISYLRRDDWKNDTTPLPRETIAALCKNLSLNDQHPLCNGSKDVYAIDFAETFKNTFLPENGNPATFQQVENIIGNYKIECQPVVYLPTSGYSYFRCFYDLNGDGYWRYAFYFYYPNEKIFSIRAGISDD